jgi:inorganic pyrophosphatase
MPVSFKKETWVDRATELVTKINTLQKEKGYLYEEIEDLGKLAYYKFDEANNTQKTYKEIVKTAKKKLKSLRNFSVAYAIILKS